MRSILTLMALAAASVAAPLAWADPCGKLSGEKRALAEKLIRATYPYECCDEPLDRCLKQKRVCLVAIRLRDDICTRVAAGQDEQRVKTAMDRRARSMMPGKRASIDLTGAEAAGDPGAKVVAVVYACARCPFCARVVPDLHRLATGPLRGKLALYMKAFPISTHAGAKEGGLALEAAGRLRRFWPFALKLYGEFDRFKVDTLAEWAAQAGIDRESFRREMAAAQTVQRLVQSKKEGLRNGVESTPTLFINGRKYQGELGRETLADVLAEEADRVQGRQFSGSK